VTLVVSLALAMAAIVVAWLFAGGVLTPVLVAFAFGAATLPLAAIGRVAQGGMLGLHRIVLGQFPDYVLRPVLLAALIVLAALLGVSLSAPTAVLLYAVSVAVAAVAAVLLLRRMTPVEIARSMPTFRTREWSTTALSMGVVAGAAVVNSQVGVTLLGLLSGPDSAGLYAVAQRGALLVAFPLLAVGVAMGPVAARLWATGQRNTLQRLATIGSLAATIGALPLVVAYLLAGTTILATLFGPAFGAANDALVILALGQGFNAATGTVAILLVMTGYQRVAATWISIGAAVNVTAALLLIPSLGVVGAAVAAVLAIVISNGVMVVVAFRRLNINSTVSPWPRSRSSDD
jgi:O-antigen/teichoic acid export membrane protein